MKTTINTCVLFREDINILGDNSDEKEICEKYLNTYQFRTQIPNDSLVIGRYSVLPYYKELENELKLINSKLINSYTQHRYIADIMQWYEDVKEYTPKTYDTWCHINDGKWVLKGKTNSRKHSWNTHMFVDGRDQLLETASKLLDDSLIKDQGIVIREYIPLESFEIGINGIPVTNEWRCFYLGEKLLTYGFYWSEFPEFEHLAKIDNKAFDLLKKVSSIVSKNTNFYVLDIAKTQNGDWILIEVNDGQMSGLSNCSAEDLYKNLGI